MENEDNLSDEFRVHVVIPSKPNPILEKLIVFKVYKRRWFILFVLCLLNCSNSMVSSLLLICCLPYEVGCYLSSNELCDLNKLFVGM
jgi:hypothetical protein